MTAMQQSSLGSGVLENWLREVREAVERDGELTEATVQKLAARTGDRTNSLAQELEQLRACQAENPDGLDAAALRERNRKAALAWVNRELSLLAWRKEKCVQHEADQGEASQAAAVLPSRETLEKILRYETRLERQMFRAMNQLERLQRIRQGEVVPAPLTMEVSERP